LIVLLLVMCGRLKQTGDHERRRFHVYGRRRRGSGRARMLLLLMHQLRILHGGHFSQLRLCGSGEQRPGHVRRREHRRHRRRTARLTGRRSGGHISKVQR